MTTLCPLILALSVSLFGQSLYAQQSATPSAQDQADIDKFIEELLPKIAAANGEQDAKLNLLAATEKAAAVELKRISDAKEKMARESKRAEQYELVMSSRIDRHGGAQSIASGAYEDYEKSIEAAAAAKSSLTKFASQEDQAKEELDIAQRDLAGY
jgi:hypothetical protein